MRFKLKRFHNGCLTFIFIIAFIISQSASVTRTYTVKKNYYSVKFINFEKNQNMVCSVYSSVGVDYELRLIREVGNLISMENLEKELRGSTYSSFIFNTGEQGDIVLNIRITSNDQTLSVTVKFTTIIQHLFFFIGMWLFGLIYVIWVIYERFPSENRKKQLKERKKERNRRIIENN